MAKENDVDQIEPHGNEEEGVNEPDYKAMYEQMRSESRKWEGRAKANKEKADKYDAASEGYDSIEERLAALNAEKAELEAKNKAHEEAEARHALVSKVAAATGLTESLVDTLNGTDEDTLMEQARAFAELKPKGAPSADEAGKFPRGIQKSATDEFGELVDDMLGIK